MMRWLALALLLAACQSAPPTDQETKDALEKGKF